MLALEDFDLPDEDFEEALDFVEDFDEPEEPDSNFSLYLFLDEMVCFIYPGSSLTISVFLPPVLEAVDDFDD